MSEEKASTDMFLQNKEEDRLALKPPDLPDGKLYHIFFSYAESNGRFARCLIDKLENKYGIKCCEHNRDFTPGWTVLDNIKHCVMSSMKTVFVISKESVTSEWCSYETELTLHMSIDLRKKILIPLLIDDCTIPEHLKPLTYIDVRGETQQWLPKLLRCIISPEDFPIYENIFPPFSSDPFHFNLHYKNLDRLGTVNSCGGMCKEGEIREYMPDNLCCRGIQVPTTLYEEQVNKLNKYLLSGLQRRFSLSVKCAYFLMGPFSVAFIFGIIGTFILAIGCEDDIDIKCDAARYCLAVALSSICLDVLALVASVYVNHKKELALSNTISELNANFMDYQIMIGFSSRPFAIYFYYYNYQPCVDYLCGQMRKIAKNQNEHDLETNDEHQSTKSTEDFSQKTALFGTLKEDNMLCQQRELSKNFFPTNEFQVRAIELLLKHSVKYLGLYRVHNLTRSMNPRHTRQVICLCEYVENVEKLILTSENPYDSIHV